MTGGMRDRGTPGSMRDRGTPGSKRALRDADIVTYARRRAILGALGAPLLAWGAMRSPAARAQGAAAPAEPITDLDMGAQSDPPRQGRGGPPQPAAALSGASDADAGPHADPAQGGRGFSRGAHSRVSDKDRFFVAVSDTPVNGRGGPETRRLGVEDDDVAPPLTRGGEPRLIDPPAGGRGRPRTVLTRVTDADLDTPQRPADPQNNGRGPRIVAR